MEKKESINSSKKESNSTKKPTGATSPTKAQAKQLPKELNSEMATLDLDKTAKVGPVVEKDNKSAPPATVKTSPKDSGK